jgi:hypothetical protein
MRGFAGGLKDKMRPIAKPKRPSLTDKVRDRDKHKKPNRHW